MSIVIVSDLNFRSQANHPLDLAEVFARNGQDVTLVAPMDNTVIQHHSRRGFKIIQTHIKPGRINYLFLYLYEAFMTMKLSPDLIIGVNQAGYIPAYLASRFIRKAHLVYYAMELSRMCEGDRGFNTRFQQRFANRADMVWSTCLERAKVMQVDWGLKEVPYLLPNTLVSPEIYPKGILRGKMHNYLPGDMVVLYTGFLSELTAIPSIIESVKNWDTKIKLAIAGFGSENFMNKMVENIQVLKLQNRVEYIGNFTKLEVFNFLPDADLGIVMRNYHLVNDLNNLYTTPGKLFEYAAFGLPVICSNNPTLLFIEKEGWGICVDPGDPLSIANGVNLLASNPGQLKDMGAIARQKFIDVYCMEIQGSRLLHEMQSKHLVN